MNNYSRYNINFADIRYLVDYTRHHDMKDKVYNKFVMIRNYEIETDIAIDKDIYFIPKELYDNNFNNVIWPTINNNNILYSSDKKLFNNFIFNENFTEFDIDNDDIYFLYDKNNNESFIPCDEIKIYKPINRTEKSSIIHIYNIINDIRIHYFCQLYDDQKNIISNEINYNKTTYNEYIKLYIPNIEELFKENQFWYKENLNLTLDLLELDNNLEINKKDIENSNNILPLSLIIEPFFIHNYNSDEYINQYIKVYSKILKNTEFNYINNPLTIYLKSYDYISNEKIYLSEDLEYVANLSIINDNTFKLKSKLGFDDSGIISLLNYFIYPSNNNMTLEESYFYYNKIDDIDKYYKFEGWDNEKFYDILEDEYGEQFNFVSFNTCGYYIEIADNIKFENTIFNSQYETRKIQDFSFRLNNIFTSWNQYPEVLFIRALFIDKYLSKVIYSDIIPITKEYFKYCINDSQIYTLQSLKNKQISDIHMSDETNKNSIKNYERFNFINNINCIVNKKESSNNNTNTNFLSNSKILYKPIFYKVYDLQKISIRNNVVQNIGINLNDFLTKVNTFIIDIDGLQISENARNDAYVIFNINGTLISKQSGYYNILNQDYEYIASGMFNLY